MIKPAHSNPRRGCLRRLFGPAVAAALLLGPATALGALDLYTVNVGPPEAALSVATDLNNHGQVVGAAGSFLTEGFLYSGGTTTTIHPPGWDFSFPLRISDTGDIVGFGEEGGVQKGYLYSGGVYTTLLPPGFTEASARATGPAGTAGGWGKTGGITRGFIYASSIYVPIVPPGYTESRVHDINASGAFVGSGSNGGDSQAFLFDGGYQFPSPPGWTDTEAIRINDNGVILGKGDKGGLIQGCYLYQGGVYTEIVHPDAAGTFCYGLNNHGVVTGLGIIPPNGLFVFIYRGGEYHRVSSPFLAINSAPPINDAFQMAGARRDPTRAAIASVLPVPDLKAGGSDGPLGVSPSALTGLKASVTAWTFAGRKVDWMLFAQTPSGPQSYDPFSKLWRPGIVPAAGIRLRDLNPVNIPPAGRSPGAYTYYFGIDLKGNGRFEPQFFVFDTLVVFVR